MLKVCRSITMRQESLATRMMAKTYPTIMMIANKRRCSICERYKRTRRMKWSNHLESSQMFVKFHTRDQCPPKYHGQQGHREDGAPVNRSENWIVVIDYSPKNVREEGVTSIAAKASIWFNGVVFQARLDEYPIFGCCSTCYVVGAMSSVFLQYFLLPPILNFLHSSSPSPSHCRRVMD